MVRCAYLCIPYIPRCQSVREPRTKIENGGSRSPSRWPAHALTCPGSRYPEGHSTSAKPRGTMPISLLDRWTSRTRKVCIIGTLRGGYITLHPKGYFKGRRVNWASKPSSVYTSDAILLDYLHTGFAESFSFSLVQNDCRLIAARTHWLFLDPDASRRPSLDTRCIAQLLPCRVRVLSGNLVCLTCYHLDVSR